VTRALSTAFVALLAFVAVLALSGLAMQVGLVPDDAVTLWASAITAGDGQMSIGRILAAYPTIPFLSSSLLEFLTPAGTPAPALLSAGALALLASIWFRSFRDMGIPLVTAATATLLIAFHPALIRAAIASPAEMFLALFLFMLGRALYDLRARSTAPEVMAAALALLGLTFTHPMGAALTCAAVPFLVFAVRPELVAGSTFYVVLALVFPSIFCVGAFAYMSWVFPGSGWSFLVSPAEGLATWSVGLSNLLGSGLTGSLSIDAALAAVVALALGAPVVLFAIAWVRRRQPLFAPAMVIIATTIAATSLAVTTGFFGDPTALAVVPPILAAVVIIRVPVVRERFRSVLPLLALGWFGGLLGLAIVDPRDASKIGDALTGHGFDAERVAEIGLGNATIGRDGVLVDTFNAPAVVLGRGRARGLLSPSDEDFALSLVFSRLEAPFVAVPDPSIGDGSQDRLNKAFPLLYEHGAQGYRLIYENASWRLFARTAAPDARRS
jgi:hypothetical protein